MKTINFKESGDPLKVKFEVKNGVLAVAYLIKLTEVSSNKTVAVYEGDNQNPEDDVYYLPLPVNVNNGRILRLSAEFRGLDPGISKQYIMTFEIYQGETLLDSTQMTGPLSSDPQSLLQFVQLKI